MIETMKKYPLFSDCDEISKNPHSNFPYKMIYYPGNNSEIIYRVANGRGFNEVFLLIIKVNDKNSLDNVNFIWKPTQISIKVI